MYSPHIPSERISDLSAFSIIQPVCSGFVTLGKEPNAVPELPFPQEGGGTCYRLSHVCCVFCVSLILAGVFASRRSSPSDKGQMLFSGNFSPKETAASNFPAWEKTSFLTEISFIQKQDIFALCNTMLLKTHRPQHEATKEGCFILFPDF